MKNILLLFAFSITPAFLLLAISPPLGAEKLINQQPERLQPHLKMALPFSQFNSLQNIPLPSYTIVQDWNGDINEWESYLRQDITYNNNEFQKEVVFSDISGSDTIVEHKEVEVYNNKWILQETLSYLPDTIDTWILHTRHLQHTDEYDNRINFGEVWWNQMTQTWDTMLDFWRAGYEYFAPDKPSRISTWTMEHEWVPQFLVEMEYNDQGLLIQSTETRADSGFPLPSRQVYSYNEQGEWSQILVYEFQDDEWLLTQKQSDFTWFDFDQEKPYFYSTYNAGEEDDEWIAFSRFTYDYNLLGDRTLLQYEYYDEEEEDWRISNREITLYNDHGFLISYTRDEGDSLSINFGFRSTYVWNDDNSPSEQIVEWFDEWEDDQWVNWYRILYGYNQDDDDGDDGDDGISVNVPVENNRFVYLYPNPASNQVHLKMNDEWQDAVVRIYNSAGNLMLIHNGMSGKNVTLDIATLPEGLYLVNISLGNQQHILRLIKR
jgi:hypothetical protein